MKKSHQLRSHGLFLAAALACTAITSPALAQEGFTTPVSEVLLDQMRNSVHREEYIANAGLYDVLPNKFGLARLAASGHVTYEGTGSHNRKFTLKKPIVRWPADMYCALSTRFVKPDDIPTPKSNLGHSCVMTDTDAAKPSWERLCMENDRLRPAPPVDIERKSLKR